MPRKNPVRDAALAEARAAERRATNKVYRNEAAGVHIRGTEYDPRMGVTNLAQLGTRDLRRHIRALNAFIDRGTQFTGLLNGVPVPRQVFQEYKELENRQNAIAEAAEVRVRNVKLPGQDQTIGQYIGSTTAWNQAVAGQQMRIFQRINRPAATIVDAKSLQTLIDNMKKKNDPGYLKDAVDRRMNSVYALLEGSGMADRIEQVKAMTVEEKRMLLDYSTFSELARERFSSGDDDVQDQSRIDEDWAARGEDRDAYIRNEMDEVISWVRETVANEFGTGNTTSTSSTNRKGSRRGRKQ